MSKKHKHRGQPLLTLTDLHARAQRAVNEGRFQQALELAKQLYKQEATPANKEFLLNTYLGRARQLRGSGYTRDAGTVLQVALQLAAEDNAWKERLAEELAASGVVQPAMEILGRSPDSPAYARMLAQAADAAVQQEAAGRNLLPEPLRDDFDRILRAFTHLEAAQDEQAREALQAIGLRSPFMEWKLLIRGLMAYYQKDDVRALENWQRLSPERLPARLAAPLRYQIDPAYRTAQPPATQTHLQKQADRFQSDVLVQQLRAIQSSLAGEQSMARPFRLAEDILPALRRDYPQMVPRLAACFYWSIISVGRPEDVPRYQRVFGPPQDDPHFNRLRAMAYEREHGLTEAHHDWQAYEKWIASNPAAWPGEQANRARALIWLHMGRNAASMPDTDKLADLPPFLRDHPDRPRPLSPSAEKCFEKSLELAPDQREHYQALFSYYEEQDKPAKAEKTARRLLERIPDDAPMLEALGDLRMEAEDYAEALSLFQRALKANPLERRLRGKVGAAHTFHARTLAEAGRFDEARAEYRAALALGEGRGDSSVLCKWAACEFKAGDAARAEELLQQALASEGNRLAIAYSMLIEVIRLKLPTALKKRFDREFKESLAEAPTGAAAAAVAETMAAHRLAGITYHGQKTHEKKVLTYLDQALKADFTETQLERICASLVGDKTHKHLRAYSALGQRKFPTNPLFYYMEAESLIAQGQHRCPIPTTQSLLARARELAAALPPDEKQKALLHAIQERQDLLTAFSPFGRMFPMDMLGGMMEDMFGYEDEDDAFNDEF